MSSFSFRIPVGLWAFALGGTGFVAGFFGPILLNPDANQGPLVGIFITGPGGALAGLVLGAIFRLLPVSELRRFQALALSCAVLATGTLYFCLPEPAIRGYVIDADVDACDPPSKSAEAALARWDEALAHATWVTPPENWRERALHNLERDPGVVLTMRIARRAAIYEHRKPWNRGRMTARPWIPATEPERYYANDTGGSCAAYLARSRALYFPFVAAQSSPVQTAKEWPPTDALGFLLLMQLGPVPDEYRGLLSL
jgi:hypothetical protein